MAATEDRPAPEFRRTRTQLETLWNEHIADPQQQALVCVDFCCQHAPHLAEWLKNKIYAALPDHLLKQLLFHTPTPDGRLQALTRLSELTANGIPRAKPRKVKLPQTRTRRAGRKQTKRLTDAEALYHSIFGVIPRLILDDDTRRLRSDPELGRLAVALHLAHQYRLWIIGREINRQAQGSGCIDKKTLRQQVALYDIDYTSRQFRRLLKAGEGLFWRQDQKHPERLYLIAWKQVGLKIAQRAEEEGAEIGFNRPGVQEQLVDVSGSLEGWEARLYAAWIAHRDGKDGLLISRDRLATLFGRSKKTIRQWEEHLYGLVAKRRNYEQHPDDLRTQDELFDIQNSIPPHAQVYIIRTQKGIAHRRFWQRPNTYTAALTAHAHKGQARKVRKLVNDAISAETDGGPWRINYTIEQHRKRVKSRKFRMGEDGDVNQPVNVFIGVSKRKIPGVGIWELMIPDPADPYPKTTLTEKRPRR